MERLSRSQLLTINNILVRGHIPYETVHAIAKTAFTPESMEVIAAAMENARHDPYTGEHSLTEAQVARIMNPEYRPEQQITLLTAMRGQTPVADLSDADFAGLFPASLSVEQMSACAYAVNRCGYNTPLLMMTMQACADMNAQQLHSKAFNDGNVTAHHGIIPQEADAPVSAMEPDEAKVYTAICERYAMQFLPPAVYDVSESTVSVDGGTLKLTAKRLSDAGFTAVFPNVSNSRVREDSDTGNPWVPAGSHTLAGISCSITEGETTPPAPYTEGTLITDMASIAKYVKDPEIREILKRKDDGKKGEHGGIGTTATRSSIIEGLKTRGYLEERKGKVRATDKAKAFYALLPPEIRGADVTARWWLIQQDIADGKADVNALQDSVIEVFNHHRETAYVGASIAGTGKAVVGKCPKCGKDVVKTGTIYACSSIKNEKQEDGTWKEVAGCGFKLFGFCTKKFTEKQAASLLDGKVVSLRGCKSKAGKTFDCEVVLQKDGSVEPIFTPRKPTKKGRR